MANNNTPLLSPTALADLEDDYWAPNNSNSISVIEYLAIQQARYTRDWLTSRAAIEHQGDKILLVIPDKDWAVISAL